MPKLPRDVSHDRLLRFLRRHGWTVSREGARHTLVARGSHHVAIPRHDVLKTGTVAKVLKETGLEARSDEL